jgi:Holliday junction resolvase RusA-like endonuclease
MSAIQIHIKPLSVNDAWQGKRYKTPAYKAYEQELLLRLPNDYEVPVEGDLEINFEFGLNTLADWDNPIKPLQDVIAKKYGFNDRRILKGTVIKNVVKKGEGYINFSIRGIDEI